MSGYENQALENKRIAAERWIRHRPRACKNRAISVMALRGKPTISRLLRPYRDAQPFVRHLTCPGLFPC